MRLRHICCVVLVAALVAATSAEATTLRRMNLDELVAAASGVARVRCAGNETRWEGGHIWTLTTFDVVETLKGNGALPMRITVRLIGGKAGHLISTVDGVPRFRVGEEAMLFLEASAAGEFTVTGWVQGTFRLRRDARTGRESVTQDTSGLSLFDPAARQFRAGGVRNIPVEEFRQRVRDSIARSERRQK